MKRGKKKTHPRTPRVSCAGLIGEEDRRSRSSTVQCADRSTTVYVYVYVCAPGLYTLGAHDVPETMKPPTNLPAEKKNSPLCLHKLRKRCLRTFPLPARLNTEINWANKVPHQQAFCSDLAVSKCGSPPLTTYPQPSSRPLIRHKTHLQG